MSFSKCSVWICLLSLSHFASSLAGAASESTPRQTAPSTFEYHFKSENQCLDTRVVNRGFTFEYSPIGKRGYIERNVHVLLETEVDTLQSDCAEGQISKVTVKGWVGNYGPPVEPSWTFIQDGDTGEVWERRFYRVMKRGCCGNHATYVYYNLTSGKKTYEGNGDLLLLDVPNTPVVRFIGFADPLGGLPLTNGNSDLTDLIGILEYGSENGPTGKVAVIGKADYFHHIGLRFAPHKDLKEPTELTLWSANKDADPQKISGFGVMVKLRLFSGPTPRHVDIIIPVQKDHLDIAHATVPKGLRLKVLEVK